VKQLSPARNPARHFLACRTENERNVSRETFYLILEGSKRLKLKKARFHAENEFRHGYWLF
jgi:hypothetical protein